MGFFDNFFKKRKPSMRDETIHDRDLPGIVEGKYGPTIDGWYAGSHLIAATKLLDYEQRDDGPHAPFIRSVLPKLLEVERLILEDNRTFRAPREHVLNTAQLSNSKH